MDQTQPAHPEAAAYRDAVADELIRRWPSASASERAEIERKLALLGLADGHPAAARVLALMGHRHDGLVTHAARRMLGAMSRHGGRRVMG